MEAKAEYNVNVLPFGTDTDRPHFWRCPKCGEILGRYERGRLQVELASGGIATISAGSIELPCVACGEATRWHMPDSDLPVYVRDRIARNKHLKQQIERLLQEVRVRNV